MNPRNDEKVPFYNHSSSQSLINFSLLCQDAFWAPGVAAALSAVPARAGPAAPGRIHRALLWQGALQMSGQQSRLGLERGNAGLSLERWERMLKGNGEFSAFLRCGSCFSWFLQQNRVLAVGPHPSVVWSTSWCGSGHWLCCTVCLPQHEYLTLCSR